VLKPSTVWIGSAVVSGPGIFHEHEDKCRLDHQRIHEDRAPGGGRRLRRERAEPPALRGVIYAEPDFSFVIDAKTGVIVQRKQLASGPEGVLEKGGILFVRTYDRDDEFAIR
jgi:hypothetical protein